MIEITNKNIWPWKYLQDSTSNSLHSLSNSEVQLRIHKISPIMHINIRSQDKNLYQNRDSNLGPPDSSPALYHLSYPGSYAWFRRSKDRIPVLVQIFLLRSYNVNFPRHKLWVYFQLVIHIMSRINPIPRNDTCYFKIHSNIIFSFPIRPSWMSLSCRFLLKFWKHSYLLP